LTIFSGYYGHINLIINTMNKLLLYVKACLPVFMLTSLALFPGRSMAQITTAAPYCQVSHVGCGNGDIASVSINTLSYSGTCSSDYMYFNTGAANTTILTPGQTYPFTMGVGPLGPYSGVIISVWIDYDRSLTLDASEWVQPSTNLTSGTVTVPISIPSNATLGLTRMRVRTRGTGNQNGAGDACLIMGSGATVDFDVTIGFQNNGPVLPPIANFFPGMPSATSPITDTVWLNSPYTLINTSSSASRVYWDIDSPAGTPLNTGYFRQPVKFTSQQYIDTTKWSNNFTYTFGTPGLWKIRLLAVNFMKSDSLRDSITKYIYVDTPSRVPKANFISFKRTVGYGDYSSFVDLSTNGPNQWYWTIDPFCNKCNTPPFFPNFFSPSTSPTPLFFGGDPGKYTVCLQAWNARGTDTVCKQDYITVTNSYYMCSGSGSLQATDDEGYIFGPSGPNFSYTRSQISGCPGFLLAPCADSIYLYVERIKMLPGDSLIFYNGSNASAPKLRTVGASTTGQLPLADSAKTTRGGRNIFVAFKLGSASVPSPYDSAGFSIHWTIKPASFTKPTAKFVFPDTLYSNSPVVYKNQSTGTLVKYSWDTDGNGFYDSTVANPTRSFVITTPTLKHICLVAYNCVGSDTSCHNVIFLPVTTKPVARFGVDKITGFNTDTFYFKDLSLNGPANWKWTFTGGGFQFLNGTSPTDKEPNIRFVQQRQYTVKLVACNVYGCDSITKDLYINIGAYGNFNVVSSGGDPTNGIGISRVEFAGIDTSTNPYSPVYQLVTGNQQGTLYRGVNYTLTVSRPSISQNMDRKVWIDFNMNGLFEDNEGELVMNEINAATLSKSVSIRIPDNQRTGSTRMRVAVGLPDASPSLNPLSAYIGAARDYIINFPTDTVKPIIVLSGANVMSVEIHKPYVDPGVAAVDNLEGDISSRYQIIGSVDTSTVGPNYLSYVVSDLYGNVSDTAKRLVFVELNRTGPSISLKGATIVRSEVNRSYTEPGWIALDNNNNDISSLVQVIGTVDTAHLGSYTLTYKITDAFGLTASANRLVIVTDTTKPVIVPVRGNPYTHQVGLFFDPLAAVRVTDNYNINLIPTYSGVVDVNNVGRYYVVYDARDVSGNIADEYVLTVDVKDTIPPTIQLNGDNPFVLDVFATFSDPYVIVNDNYWPKNTINVTTTGTVDNTKLGSYVKTYTATDPSGNKASVSRTINVVDRTSPEIRILGDNPVNLPRWHVFVEPGVALVDNYNTDAEMRPMLIVANSLPLNAEGKPFGNEEGVYSVKYKVRDLSGNQSAEVERVINVIEPVTGIAELLDFDHAVSVYPNPSNGVMSIRVLKPVSGNIDVVVYNVIGKEVYHTSVPGAMTTTQELNLGDVASGIYMMKVQVNGKEFVRKIQVSR
jgi:PKD repeat protein